MTEIATNVSPPRPISMDAVSASGWSVVLDPITVTVTNCTSAYNVTHISTPASREKGTVRRGPKNIAEIAPNGIEYELKRLYYDIAGTAFRPAIAALTSLVPTTQILFGSDNPFVPLADTAQGLMQLGLSEDDLRKIGRENALALLPRLKSS